MKFAVGEIVVLYSNPDSEPRYLMAGVEVTVTAVASPGVYINRFGGIVPCDYEIKLPGGEVVVAQERELRKRPDSAEDPALTRLKKLLLQDQPKPVRVHG